MVIEVLFNLVSSLLNLILSMLPSLPNLPDGVLSNINSFFDIIFGNLSLLSFFVHVDTLKAIVPVFLGIIAFDKVYVFIMWIVRKIPMLGIK